MRNQILCFLFYWIFFLEGKRQIFSPIYSCGTTTGTDPFSVTFFDFIQSSQNFPLDIIVYHKNISMIQVIVNNNISNIYVNWTQNQLYQHQLTWFQIPQNNSIQELITVKDSQSSFSCSYAVTFAPNQPTALPSQIAYIGQLTKFNSYFAEVDAVFLPGQINIATSVTPDVEGNNNICNSADFKTYGLSDWNSFLTQGNIYTALQGQSWLYNTLADCDGSNTLQVSSVDMEINGQDVIINKTQQNDLSCTDFTTYQRILVNQEAQQFLNYIKTTICAQIPGSQCNLVGAAVVADCGSISSGVWIGIIVVIVILVVAVIVFVVFKILRKRYQVSGGKFYRMTS